MSIIPSNSIPPYQTCGGVSSLIHDLDTNRIHFIYMCQENPGQWIYDEWTSSHILDNSVRMYRLVDPDPWYTRYHFATVNDNGVLVQYTPINDNREMLLEWIRVRGEAGIPYSVLISSSSPPDDDREYRRVRYDSTLINTYDLNTINPLMINRDYTLEEVPSIENNSESALGVLGRVVEAIDNITNNRRINNVRQAILRASTYPPRLIIPEFDGLLWGDIEGRRPIQRVQKHVADLVIADAIKSEITCPISMELLQVETAVCVAPCYHCFQRESITRWLTTNHTCPQCRETCSL